MRDRSVALLTIKPFVAAMLLAATWTGAIPARPAEAATQAFQHPGILVSRAQLDYVKARAAAGKEPQKSLLARAQNSWSAKLTYVAKPVALVQCGSYNNPNFGCTDEMNDANAAYTQALLWYYTGNQAYADNSRKIINAWSSTLQDHSFDTTTYKNGILQAGWAGEMFPRAAEILRYTNSGWTQADTTSFSDMLDRAFLPRVRNGWAYGNANWNYTMNEATMNIAVFKDDRALYDEAVEHWKNYLRGYIYHSSDGPVPARIPEFNKNFKQDTIWYDQKVFVDGFEAETCRDTSHTMMGIAASINAAETARIQGTDLYGYGRDRLVPALEFQAKYLNGAALPDWLCPGKRAADGRLNLGGTAYTLTGEIGYNAYANRLGVAMPETKKMIDRQRPTLIALHMGWESLTHGDTGNLGGNGTPAPIGSPTAAPTTPTPTANASPSAIKGDLNGDGHVNVQDLSILLSQWGKAGSADLNGDKTVSVLDLSIQLKNWGT